MTTIKNDQLFTELQQRPDMNFEFVNETLCRMVEPEPLTETATFPCVVRMIQDDSPMGRFNKWNWEGLTELIHVRELLGLPCDNMIPCIEAEDEDHISHYEIIGYPVETGSAEWALYQMMQGKKVTFGCDDDRFYALSTRKDGSIGCYIGKITDGSCYESGEDFVADHVHTVWRIYEPKPEPAFKVGDWVECNGNQRLIEVIGRDLGRGNYYHFAHGFGGAYANSIIRKLDPSGVIVDFGSVRGWIRRKTRTRNSGYNIDVYSVTNCWLACIRVGMLDTPTRELVESLLKAQEEK